MKTTRSLGSFPLDSAIPLTAVLVLFLLAALPARCQMLPCTGTNSPKFVLLPQLDQGFDVKDSRDGIVLADDFLCTQTGPITDIHVWSSWLFDQPGTITNFQVAIYSDVPVGTNFQTGYVTNSHPGAVLWWTNFPQGGTIMQGIYTNFSYEYFYNPTNNLGMGNDTVIWYYCFFPAKPFIQQGSPGAPTNYWLAIRAQLADLNTNIVYGWKSSATPYHDPAVWMMSGSGLPGPGAAWKSMTNPMTLQPLHLSMVITTTNTPSVTDTNKWTQWPDASINGLDVKATDPKILADDFLCTSTGPITQVRIWGSWRGENVPPPAAQPCFNLALWTDVPTNVTGNFSHPGVQLCTASFGSGQYTYFQYTNGIYENFYDPNTGYFIGEDYSIWEYVFNWPTNGFVQTNGTVYWLSVTADCIDTNQFMFGWKTCPTNWNDDAVWGDAPYYGGEPPYWNELMRPPFFTNSLDMAFQIITTPPTNPPPLTNCCPVVGGVKFEQDPDLIHGIDWNASSAPDNINAFWLADDFACTNTGPITDIHLWGSWRQDQPDNNSIYTLAIWNDVPTNAVNPYSHPGDLLWYQTYTNGQFVNCSATTAFETFASPWEGLMDWSSDLRYLCFYLNQTNPFIQHGSPQFKTNYWLSLSVLTTNVIGPIGHGQFGWKSSTNAYNDQAVTYYGAGPLPPSDQWGPISDSNGMWLNVNLAFKITGSTNPCPQPQLVPTNPVVGCNDAWPFVNPTIVDPCCTNYGSLSGTGPFLVGNCPTKYQYNWAYTNCYGQVATCFSFVTVTTPPPVMIPTNVVINCGSPIPMNPPGVLDLCCSNTIIPVWQSSTTNNGACISVITQYWKAVDCNCTNLFAITNQVITVVDPYAPILSGCGTNMSVLWGTPWSFAQPTAQYACSGSNAPVGILSSNTVILSPCSSSNIVVWYATNLCSGAYSTCTQIVMVTCTVCTEGHGVKYVQMPNLYLPGVDVWNNGPWMLADDFVCTNTGPISDIHIWGSWLNDQSGPNTLNFWLAIYDDVPAVTNLQGLILTNSHPGKLKWSQWFAPGQYAENPYSSGQEGFLNPGLTNSMGNDFTAWYYCFYPTAPLMQQGSIGAPKTYWLVAYAQPPTNNTFQYGWKSTFAVSNDISVHALWPGSPPTNDPAWAPTWQQLPLGGLAPVDLAFKITTDTNYNDVMKYIQWPQLTNGYDVWNSLTIPQGVADGPWLLADDFTCTNTGYITDVHLWGSWYYDWVATNQITFWIGLFNDVPAVTNSSGQVISNSHPGALFWQHCYPPGSYEESLWSPAYEAFLDPGPAIRLGSDFQAWQYKFILPDPPMQKGSLVRPQTYWVAAFAQLPPGLQKYFGWKTATNVQHDVSVHTPWMFPPCPTNIPPTVVWTPTHDDSEQPLDLAFEISTMTNCSASFLTIDKISETQVIVTWPSGTLQWSTNVIGPYRDVQLDLPGPVTSPFTDIYTPPPLHRFYRVRCN